MQNGVPAEAPPAPCPDARFIAVPAYWLPPSRQSCISQGLARNLKQPRTASSSQHFCFCSWTANSSQCALTGAAQYRQNTHTARREPHRGAANRLKLVQAHADILLNSVSTALPFCCRCFSRRVRVLGHDVAAIRSFSP